MYHGAKSEVRRFVGLAAWAGGVAPYLRPMVVPIWAATPEAIRLALPGLQAQLEELKAEALARK